jgi:hypothetical protein
MAAAPPDPAAPAPHQSFDTLVLAMNDPSRERVAAAFSARAVIDRYDADEAALLERYRGLEEIERWLRRTPSKYKFARVSEPRQRAGGAEDDVDAAEALASATDAHDHAHAHAHDHAHAHGHPHAHPAPTAHAQRDDDATASTYRADQPIWVAEYSISSDDFHNRGHWHLQLDGDGRITWMRHHPLALRA